MAENDTLLSQIAFSLVVVCTYCLRLRYFIFLLPILFQPPHGTQDLHRALYMGPWPQPAHFCLEHTVAGMKWPHGLTLCGWGTETNLLASLPEKADWMQVGSGNSWELHVGQELTSCTDSHTLIYFPRFLNLPSNVLWVVFPCHWNYFNQLNLFFLGCREIAPGPDRNHCAE